MSQMTPKEIVHELDRHIIGQDSAKRAVAIALRNRWRRMRLDEELRQEVTPKNILMIGPTGVGKTEIARRLAKLANAPFVKVEATKFTEVGYVGRDVESIIRDLIETALKMERESAKERVQQHAREAAEERILDILLPPARNGGMNIGFANESQQQEQPAHDTQARKTFRRQLRDSELDEQEIEAEVPVSSVAMDIMGPPGMEEMASQLQDMLQNLNQHKRKKRQLKIKDALKIFQDEEAGKLVNEDDIKLTAVEQVEQHGIVFIDEIDKICRREDVRGGDVSREGVQRDLLPLIEGSTISTKYGMINTDHILFICSGAFHLSKPSDLVPELQGRLPIRVELKSLTTQDFVRILTEPQASITEQYVALMSTEEVTLKFDKGAIERIAEIAYEVNDQVENIGARRLHTVMEHLLDKISYEASDRGGEQYVIDTNYVNQSLKDLSQDKDLSRYIL